MSQNVALMQIKIMKMTPREEGGASRAQVKALAVLAFVNKHPLISTSLLNLSQLSNYTVHKTFAYMNYTDVEQSGMNITT